MNAPPTGATHGTDRRAAGLLLATLGVVYGDIGTSPLYAFRESLAGAHGAGTDPASVYGVLSMIFWAVTLVVSIKYVLLVLRADNQGEGGVLALLALVLRQMPVEGRWRGAAIGCGLAGAAMFYGDSVITPAISVLSAVEGLEVVTPAAEGYALPATIAILLALFMVQRRGTARVGALFGPVMLLWFAALAVLGAAQIARHPDVLRALEPAHALAFALREPARALVALAAVFLTVTGGEALYADMGHFGRGPIQRAWFGLVMPSLLLNYFGQGALVLADASAARNPFFLLAPGWLQWPLVILATAATVIASQAVISGAFSLTSQAIKLGLAPRTTVEFTSATEAGQIYVPVVNWLLLAAVVALVLAFGSSSALAAAYGVAVVSTMLITTLGVAFVAAWRWAWPPQRVVLVFAPLAALDLLFVVANTAKIPHGGWFPLVFAAGVYTVLSTWHRGRERVRNELKRSGIALEPFLKSLATYPPQRIEGTAVFMTPVLDTIPLSLLHNLKHNRVMHERVIFLTAVAENEPHVPPENAARIRDLGDGCYHVTLHRGFHDSYDIVDIAKLLSRHYDFELIPVQTSFFLSRETLIPGRRGGMAGWRKRLFAWMNRSAQPASDFFRLPPGRVIEIGTQIVI
ncbi:MAG: potassium transporter Kup [Burkholderiaceae bacterium]